MSLTYFAVLHTKNKNYPLCLLKHGSVVKYALLAIKVVELNTY